MNKITIFCSKIKIYLCQKYCLKSRNGIGRPSSYPYLSGDTYRSISDLVIENLSELQEFENFLMTCKTKNLVVVYLSGALLEGNELQFYEIFDRLESIKYKFKMNLIVHDCDRSLPEEFFKKVGFVFNKIYAINIQIGTPAVINIPLGIENASFERCGVPELYRNHSKQKIFGNHSKTNMLFSAFNVATNFSERIILKNLIEKYGYKYSGANFSPEEYIEHLSKSYFTLSPRGNGKDCHRTWEAIYLDCVPVILTGTLSKELVDDLPVLVVKDWEDFLSKSDQELKDIYMRVSKMDVKKSYAPYWINEIRGDN